MNDLMLNNKKIFEDDSENFPYAALHTRNLNIDGPILVPMAVFYNVWIIYFMENAILLFSYSSED